MLQMTWHNWHSWPRCRRFRIDVGGKLKKTFHGGCHCGAVRFAVEADENFKAVRCNCSICAMTGFLHLIVPSSDFRLLQGGDMLATYSFNTRTAKHQFCSVCGIKSFYVPRSNPDGYSVNVHCIDGMAGREADEDFDGQNWEENAAKLKHLSEDGRH